MIKCLIDEQPKGEGQIYDGLIFQGTLFAVNKLLILSVIAVSLAHVAWKFNVQFSIESQSIQLIFWTNELIFLFLQTLQLNWSRRNE